MERLIFDMQLSERAAVCDKHGSFTQKQRKIGNTKYRVWLGCPACDTEKEQQNETQLAAQQAAAFQALLGRSSLPERFRDKTFDNFMANTPEQQLALTITKAFANNFPQHLNAGTGLIFLGGVGTGKSHLAAAILQAILPKYIGVYVTVADYLRTIRETWRPTSQHSETQVLRHFVHAPLLVLDELGKQYGTEGEQNIIFDVLDGRYREKKPTIVMGNLTNDELEKYLGGAFNRPFERNEQSDCVWLGKLPFKTGEKGFNQCFCMRSILKMQMEWMCEGVKMMSTTKNKKNEQKDILKRYEPIVWLSELPAILRKTPETVRRMRKDGKLPDPDVQLSYRSTGWNLSTLRAAGLNIKLKEELSECV